MKIKILCLGRLNKDEENELCKRYESRLKSLKNSGITNFAIEHISKKELENIIKNKIIGSMDKLLLAIAQPITGGNAPAAPPITIF